jgi:hypothetical protein
MARKYYTLLSRINGRWGVEFGAYERDTVKDELTYRVGEFKKSDLKIITTSDKQKDINAAIEKLNAK